jgi:PTS system fructose-specific IIC component/PTS system nitrogen regulatory IIA component
MGILLSEIFDPRSIKIGLAHSSKAEVLAELVEAIKAAHPDFDREEMLAAVNDREGKMSTGIAPGVAIPHGYCRGVGTIAGALGISPAGIEYQALDDGPVHVVFMLVMGQGGQENHLRVLNRIFSLVKSEAFPRLREAKSAGELHGILSRFR